MNLKMLLALLAVLPLFSPLLAHADICKTSKEIDASGYAAEMGTNKVTFLVVDLRSNQCHVLNEKGLDKRHAPYSSFKIPHTLIALETGAAKSLDEAIAWNPDKRPAKDFWPSTWKKDQTLASAFKHSAAWYYQELVPRIAAEEYKNWLARFQYGNQHLVRGSDDFWLNGELKISPREQVNFLVCLVKGGCGVSEKNISALELVALQETKNSLSLYAKTGAGSIDPNNNDGAFEGWYVGYIKDAKTKPVAAFAIYVEAENFSAIKDFRRAFALRLLADSGLWQH